MSCLSPYKLTVPEGITANGSMYWRDDTWELWCWPDNDEWEITAWLFPRHECIPIRDTKLSLYILTTLADTADLWHTRYKDTGENHAK